MLGSQTYYHNTETNKTQWEVPDAFKLDKEPPTPRRDIDVAPARTMASQQATTTPVRRDSPSTPQQPTVYTPAARSSLFASDVSRTAIQTPVVSRTALSDVQQQLAPSTHAFADEQSYIERQKLYSDLSLSSIRMLILDSRLDALQEAMLSLPQ